MKTTKEKIEVMQAYEDGREIEFAQHLTNVWMINGGPNWNWDCFDYRIKQRTILVNGIEVPEPCRVMPPHGTKYFHVSFVFDDGVASGAFTGGGADLAVLRSGVLHLTESAARQHYEALIAPSRVKK